jgi:hypothetical protein
VANESDSLFRAISDNLFTTQHYSFIVEKAAQLVDNDENPDKDKFGPKFPLVCQLGQNFNFGFEIICSTDETLRPFCFEPIPSEDIAVDR